MEGSAGLVQPIWAVSMDEIVRCIAGARIEEERNEKLTTLLNIFSKHGVDVLADLLKRDCRIRAVYCLFEAFIYLWRDANLLRVGTVPV